MSSPIRQPRLVSPGEDREDSAEDPDARLRQLRGLLLGPEQAQLEELRRRLDHPETRRQELSGHIAEALALRATHDRKLQATLQPLIEEALRISVERNPAMLATALFPIIGEAVRKAVAHALEGMFDSLNQMLDRGFSVESWRWRFESWRSGKSFGEIALTRSLRYRVEQVFLIHRETGLLLEHVAAEAAVVEDTDMVSGMLTAIQDFARDSFRPSASDQLEVVGFGEFKLWLQHGPLAMLAAVVSGQPPAELRQVLEREVEAIHAEFTPAMQQFDGDASTVAGTEVHLRRCLLGGRAAPTRSQTRPRKSYRPLWAALAALLLILAVLAGLRIRNNQRWSTYIGRLEAEPGLVVIRSERRWFGYSVRGLRDPLAADPAVLLAASGIPTKKVATHWEPYLSLDPHFDQMRRVETERAALQKQVIRFGLDSADLPLDQFAALDAVEDELNTLRHAADATGSNLRIEVSGHTDRTGKESHNQELSRQRAESVVRALVMRGIPAAMLEATGMADQSPHRESQPGTETYPQELDRRVTFHVVSERARH
jgi:outer membrane protein OmpA-like peptidoglycan-associated protein